jgi:Na+/proline symporter
MASSPAFVAIAVAFSFFIKTANGDCLSNQEFNDFFIPEGESSIPLTDSCCQFDVCGLPCPEDVPKPSNGFSIAVILSICISFAVGVGTFFLIRGQSKNYFVAGRSLPLWIVCLTLGAQSIDSNALLGNADLSYKYHFYDGAVLPIGLGLSLILNGVFLARHINAEHHALTLVDILAKRYGVFVEILASIATIISFLMLLAGNLVGMGVILSYLWGTNESSGIWITAAIVLLYTAGGGLFSVAYTDVIQGIIGWSGCIVTAFWFIHNESVNAPPPSAGFPDYVYPDNIGDGGICDLYNGTACVNIPDACCYNTETNAAALDNGAYPFGDQRIFKDQMSNYLALTPFPNAMFWNWATIFILGFGNLAALDFQARCLAAKTPRTATLGCLIGGCFTFLVGIPFAYLGAITRKYYGPDSIYAEFEADSCHELLGLPTCGMWIPSGTAFIQLLTNQAPAWIGAWCLIGICAASMSTADGAILAMGTVFSHNVVRQLDAFIPDLITNDNLLSVARVSTIPFTIAAACIGAFYRSDHSAGATGYLLIVAFDVVLATVVVPLFGCFYAKNPSPRAALLSMLAGGITRVILEFALPKDGFLLLPYKADEFLNYGTAASTTYPVFFDKPEEDLWNPDVEACEQPYYEDFTGVDSLSAFLVSILVFVLVQSIEGMNGGKPIFTFNGMEGYVKDIEEDGDEDEPEEKGYPQALDETNPLDSSVNK